MNLRTGWSKEIWKGVCNNMASIRERNGKFNETLTALMDAVMKDEDIPSDCYIRHQAEGIDIICSVGVDRETAERDACRIEHVIS